MTGDTQEDRLRKLIREGRPELPKRFYTDVTVDGGTGGGARVLLDGRQVRTPGKNVLDLPSATLAEAIAEEWRAQTTHIDPQTMPMTRLANSVIDAVALQLDAVRDEIVKYAGSDLVCYRADTPSALVDVQRAAWDPVLAWARDRLGARFRVVDGIMPVEQPSDALEAYAAAIRPFGAFQVGALHVMATLSGSSLIALAHALGERDVDAAWAAAHVDEDWQISQWGEDAEAAERRALRKREFLAASRTFAACLS